MLFNSLSFLIFFPVVVLIFFIMPKRVKYIWLLVASYYFYMNWNPKYALLMLASTLITWLTGLGISILKSRECDTQIRQKLLLAGCFAVNLAILGFFKYFDFFLMNLNAVIGKFGLEMVQKPFDVVLPVGISFYTFQALGYIIDVYKEKVSAEKNVLKYALFVSFFPQLVAGPIERTENLLNQIKEIPSRKPLDYDRITNGLVYMLYGFFLKMVISDRIAILVDNVFDSWFLYGGVELLVAAIGFALQIYCDFSSYSIIAIGAAQVMGFTLMENFEAPYFSSSVKEFWRRWHISLSTWFRDYVYIPLGGNRRGKWRKNINLMLTFLLSGLWHGANWTFVVWGGIHGAYQIMGEAMRPIKNRIYPQIGIRLDSISYKLGQIITTFILTDIAWIFFRAENVSDAIGYLYNIVARWNPWAIWDRTLYGIGLSNYEWNILLFSLLILFIVDLIRYLKKIRLDVFLSSQGVLFKGIMIVLMALMIVVYGQYGGGYDARQFIYFQF